MSVISYSGHDISTIETKVPEEVMLRAEEIYDQRFINGLTNPKKGKWDAIVIDQNIHYTTRINLKNQSFDQAYCNCNLAKEEGICPHILATIFLIRTKLAEAETEKKAPRRASNFTKSISALLKNISRDELEQFILYKSKKDKNFKLLLQARFLEYLSSDQFEPFVESTFPTLTRANEKISASRLNTFLEIANELILHFKNLIAKDDLKDAYVLIFLLLRKSFYVKHYLTNDNQRFTNLHKGLLSNYLEIYKLIEAPEYKEQIEQQLEELLSTSYISASTEEERQLWMLLFAKSSSKDKLKKIIELYLSREVISNYDSFYFIKMIEIILEENETKLHAEISARNAQESYRIIQFLHKYKKVKECNEAMHYFYTIKNLNHPLSKLIINAVDFNPRFYEEFIAKTIDRFIKFRDTEFLGFLQEHSKNWKETADEIVDQIGRREDHALLIGFYLEVDQQEKALDSLKQHLDWHLLRQFDQRLITEARDACLSLYLQVLKDYLSDHFGTHAKDFLKNVFSRLDLIGEKSAIPMLKEQLAEAFPGRFKSFG